MTRRLLIAPIATTNDVVNNAQLDARGIWSDVKDLDVSERPIRVASSFVDLAGVAPLTARAPHLGEHSQEVLASWAPIDPRPTTQDRAAALVGLRVVDLTWALSGPATARFLSDFGATVIHIESSHRIDSARTVQPFLDDDSAGENAAVYHNMNAGKLSLSLNLGCDEGRHVLDDLVAWADVLIESFSPRGRLALGLDFERLSTINPRLVMMSSCLFGQDGPLADYAGFGNMAAGLTGFFELTGWPDRAPAGPFSAYTDYVSPRFAVAALLRAIEERTVTGHGQYLDFAQAEAAIHFLTPALLDAAVNGHAASRDGNDDERMCPHGVYRCVGDDRWVAIAVRDDEDWRRVAELLGASHLATLDLAGRRQRRRDLDELLTSWTCVRSAVECQQALVEALVPAHAVQHSPDCIDDPQLQHLGHFITVQHPHHGTVTVEGSRISLAATPSRLQRGAPILGLDNTEVLTSILGYDDARIGDLYVSGALD